MKTQHDWRDAILLGTLTYYHKKMQHQFGSRQAASGLQWGEALHRRRLELRLTYSSDFGP